VRRTRRFLAPLLGLTLVGGAWSAAAGAQEPDDARLVLRAVDSREPGVVKVVVSWSGPEEQLDSIAIRENRRDVEVDVSSAVDAGFRNDIVFLVDSSTSTDANALLTNVEEALSEFVGGLPQGTRASIVAAGAAAQVLQPLTSDAALLREAVTDLSPGGEGGVMAGVLQAAGRLDAAGTVGTVVLFTDGAREESISSSVAKGGLDEAGAVLHVVALSVDGFNDGTFRDLAESSGGTLRVTDDPEAVSDMLTNLRPELTQLAVATYETDVERGIQDLGVSVGDTTVAGSYISGGFQVGAQRLHPRPGVEPSGPSFLRTELGKTVGFLGVLVAAILFTFGLVSAFVREDTGLSRVLRPYSDGFTPEQEDDPNANSALAQTAFLRRAVEATESFAQRQGFLERVERMLEKADMPLRAGEALFFYVVGVLLLLALAFALTSNVLGALVLGLLGILIPPSVVNFLANRKKKRFEGLLPDTLQLLSSTLRAGYSMMQGVEAVSQEVSEPMGKELRRVVTEARLGRPLEEALDGVAERMGSADFGWAVMAIRIQREVGGNLSELLMTVAETMTQRERLRRDVNSLTAEGRMSAYVLGGLPVGLGIVLYTINPDYIGRLFDHTVGQIMLGASLVSMAVGFAWMFKIIKIEI
jgi:tight adherence protein B